MAENKTVLGDPGPPAAPDVVEGPQLRIRVPLVPDDSACDRKLHNLVQLTPEEAGVGSRLYAGLQRELQRMNDQLIVAELLTGRPMRSLALWATWERLATDFLRALGETSSIAGLNWVPTTMSARLQDMVAPELRVAALFRQVDMTSAFNDLGVIGSDPTAYYVAGNSQGPASDPTTSKATLSAKKLMARVVASREMDEDSAVMSEPAVTSMLATAIGRGIEDALVNGDVQVYSTTAQDTDMASLSAAIATTANGTATITRASGSFYTDKVKAGDLVTGGTPAAPAGLYVVSIESATSLTVSASVTAGSEPQSRTFTRPSLVGNHARRAWDGLRKKALVSTMPNQDLSTWSDANLEAIRKAMTPLFMGPPSDLAIIVGPKGAAKFNVPASGFAGFLHVDRLSSAESRLPGQIGNWLGTPVILSEFVREDVNANGVNDNTAANTKTFLLVVNRRAAVLGRRRGVVVSRSGQVSFDYDQLQIRGTWRGDFQDLFDAASAVNKLVGIGRNFS